MGINFNVFQRKQGTIVRTPEKVFGTTFSTEIILVVQGI